MNTYRRLVLIATILATMSFFVSSCGDDDAVQPTPDPIPPALTWQNPMPSGDVIQGVWGSAANNVYAVGGAGTLLRYDGSTWQLLSKRLGMCRLWDISGTAANDIFVVGDKGEIWHYDGSLWSQMTSGTNASLRGVYAFSSRNVWAVGDGGVIRRWGGSNWQPIVQNETTDNLIAIWGISGSRFFVLTDNRVTPLLLNVNGNWALATGMPSINAQDIWGTAADSLFIVGSVGTIAQLSGTTWDFSSPGGTETLSGVYGFAANSAFAVGSNSTILKFDGTNWRDEGLPGEFDLLAVWGTSATDAHALGTSGGIYDLGAVGAWTMSSTTASAATMRSITAAGSSRYAAGVGGIILSNPGNPGSGWMQMSSGTALDLNSIFAVGPNDVYAVGVSGEIRHYDGSSWSGQNSTTNQDLGGVWGNSDTSVVAVGADSPLFYDGTSWSAMTAPANASDLLAVWGAASNNIVAVGRNGTIMRFDGTQWVAEASPVSTTLRVVTGSAADNIYAAGDNAVVLHYDGTLPWTDVMNGQFQLDFYGAAISSTQGVFVTGDLGGICHRVGSSWEELPFTNQNQRGVAVDGSGNVFFAGQGGSIIRRGK